MSARAATSAGDGASSMRIGAAALDAQLARLVRSAAGPGRRSGGSRRRRACRSPRRARIISWPMLPKPSRPSVRPYRPRAFEYSFLFQCPARSSATLSGMRRSSASSSAERQLGDGDGVLARDSSTRRCRASTRPRRRWCCSRRRRARPATARPRRASRRVTVVPRTTSTSAALVANRLRAAPRPSGRAGTTTSQPAAFKPVEAALSRTCRRRGPS